jgi:mono/diheme cytochrome c family protein
MALASAAVLGNVYRNIGLVLGVIVLFGFVVYVLVNVLRSGKPEVGSEIELAPNRKPYLSDEELEGPKLDRALSWGLLTLIVVAVGLPLYWVLEPGRQSGAVEEFNEKFVSRGADMFAPTGDNLQALNCAGCHGGMEATGGAAVYNLTQPDGSVEVVNWKAPALNTVLLRYDREEVEFILTYGRPFSPMPAWGVEGGGPLNEQQIQNLIDYLESIQISPEEAQSQAEDALRGVLGLEEGEEIDYDDRDVGEALFNLGLTDGFAGGAYACGRCHTHGWSYANSLDELEFPGGGAMGPNLTGGAVELQFPRNPDPAEGESPFQEQLDFITVGSDRGVLYGSVRAACPASASARASRECSGSTRASRGSSRSRSTTPGSC